MQGICKKLTTEKNTFDQYFCCQIQNLVKKEIILTYHNCIKHFGILYYSVLYPKGLMLTHYDRTGGGNLAIRIIAFASRSLRETQNDLCEGSPHKVTVYCISLSICF